MTVRPPSPSPSPRDAADGVGGHDDDPRWLRGTELARDIAQKFNNDYGVEVFPQPEPVIRGPGMRVMSLRDGSKKMSKSDPSEFSRINMTDDADAIAGKVRKATTDPNPLMKAVKKLAGKE